MSTAFLLLTLLAAPAANDVPTPASAFGFEPCAERELATYEGIADYFRKLDAASDRMNLYEIGKTAEGRTMLLSVISSEENLRNLDRHKAISKRLVLAKDLGDEEARARSEEHTSELQSPLH